MKKYTLHCEGWFEKNIQATSQEVWDLARELRGEFSTQEYPDPKNTKEAIEVLRQYVGITTKEN